MSNPFMKTWLAAALCVLALGSTAALAEPDTFGLGTGNDKVHTVTISGPVNSYAQVTMPLLKGEDTVEVGVCTGATRCFLPGDLVMVLQATGLRPDAPEAATGNVGPIDIDDRTKFQMGLWELARLKSVVGSTLTLTAPLIRDYPSNITQVIRVPEYTDLTINPARNISAKPWDGKSGGVVAFLATGTVTNNGSIVANGAGFRGGTTNDDDVGNTNCTKPDEPLPGGARKGEGLVDARYGNEHTGLGNVTSGGGGGVCYKSGGGGGGNGGAGGRGGYSFDGRAVGGLGGAALQYSLAQRLTFGGGGGAGHADASTGRSGGAGGGAIFIRANKLAGTGFISATGGAGNTAEQDAGSGGGAGGSIYLRLAGSAACGATGISANGGIGGSSNSALMGPGGGGGGGRILFQAESNTCSFSVSEASPGTQSNTSDSQYGAKPGSAGLRETLSGRFVVPPVPSVTEPANGSFTRSVRPDIKGKVPVEATGPFSDVTVLKVLIIIDGVYVDSSEFRVTPYANGDYLLPLLKDLSEGRHTVEAVTEYQGVQSARSTLNAFTVDKTPPGKPAVLVPANGASTKETQPEISGTAEPGGKVTVIIDGKDYGPVTADADGKWTYVPTTPLSETSHTVEARTTDAAGNTSPVSDTTTFTVDKTAPATPAVSTPAEGLHTQETRPEITGTAEPGVDVTVIINGTEYGPVKADADGKWSYTPTTPLPEGKNQVETRARDAAGNESPVSPVPRIFYVDTTRPVAPEVLTPTEGATVQGPTPLITGTAEANSRVTIILDGIPVDIVDADADGKWSYTPKTALLDDWHTVQAQATDAAGNTGPTSEVRNFYVDSTPPPAPEVRTPANGATVGTHTPELKGTAEPGSTVTIYVDGEVVGQVKANASGEWSMTVPDDKALDDGQHTVKAQATDAVGNPSPESSTNTFTVDTTPPAAPVVLTPANGTTVSTHTPKLEGTAEPGSTVTVYVDGKVVGQVKANDSGAWSVTVPADKALDDGQHTVRAQATDAAGNPSVESNTNTFTVDTTGPDISITSGPSGVTRDSSASFSFSSSESGVSYECRLDNTGDFVPCTSPHPLSNLADGPHTFEVRARDAQGNVSATPATRTWTVDTTAPAAPVVSAPTDGATVETTTPAISGTGEPGSTITVIIDGQVVGTAPVDASGNWSYTPTVPLEPGSHTVTVRTTDPAGNESPVSSGRTFTVVQGTTPDSGDIAFLGDGFGGCSATGGDSSLVLLSLGTFLALARRRRR
ncbi:adhesin [Archangium violaceum]|uniref:adventurous gliding motility protein AgmC n=1 Tax=Archangium violaceum TaxID=83451 RepID=UPI0019501C9E|nr:Ig-like domain-containing protein [Archangium violaceum]QRN96324.1 adhesin [Archangium violaceum]